MSEQTEEKTILILTDDMTDKLPESVQESVVWLSNELRPKELIPFNPIVKALLDLRETAVTIKYDPKKEKETTQQYKDLKKEIGSFNSSLATAKKTIKGPYDEIGKKILVVEKGCKSESDAIMEELNKEFKPWLDAEAAKKAAKEAEKEAERNREINKLKRQNQEKEDLVLRQTTYNTAKYDVLASIKTQVISQLNQLSLDSVERVRKSYESATFLSTVETHEKVAKDFALLLPEQVEELKTEFEKTKKEIHDAYKAREEELRRNEALRLSSEREKGQLEGTKVVPADAPAQPDVHQQVPDPPAGAFDGPPKTASEWFNHWMVILDDVQHTVKEQGPSFESPDDQRLARHLADMIGQVTQYVIPQIKK